MGERTTGASDLVWLAGPEAGFQLRLVRLRRRLHDSGSATRRAVSLPEQPRRSQPRQPRRQPLRDRHLPGARRLALRRNRQRRERLRGRHLPVRRRPRPRTAGRSVRGRGGRRTRERGHGRRAPRRSASPPATRCRASTRSSSRWTARSCRAPSPTKTGGAAGTLGQTSDGLAAFLYAAALPAGGERPGRPRHHQDRQRLPPARGQRARRRGQLGPRARTPDHGPQRGRRAAERDQRHRPGGAVGAVGRSTRKRRLVAGFGRAVTIQGRLTTAAGVPIAGASIDVSALPSATGARTAAMPAARTNASGRFTVTVPGGVSSRTLHFGYRTRLGEEEPGRLREPDARRARRHRPARLAERRRASAGASTSADACAADRSPPTASSSCSRPAPRAAPGSSSRTSAATAADASAPATASSSRGRPTTSSGPSPNPSPTTPTAEGASNLVEVFER